MQADRFSANCIPFAACIFIAKYARRVPDSGDRILGLGCLDIFRILYPTNNRHNRDIYTCLPMQMAAILCGIAIAYVHIDI